MKDGVWERVYNSILRFPKRFNKDDQARALSWTDWRRCPHCGRFMNQDYGITTRHRVIFEDKVYVGYCTDVYGGHYSKEITWAPHFILHPRWVFWCTHCGYIVLMPDLEAK